MNIHVSKPDLDYKWLNKELDRTKAKVFQGKNASFLGALMCSLEFEWDERIETAATNGLKVFWNPYYFMALSPEGRVSILVHELWHVALLHMLRKGDRVMQVWNMACDTVLDNFMHKDGYIVDQRLFPQPMFPPGTKGFYDPKTYGDMSAEEIYDLMIKNPPPVPPPQYGGGSGDLVEPGEGGAPGKSSSPSDITHTIINNVVAAAHTSKMAGKLPGSVELVLDKFLHPKLPWKQILNNFFNQLSEQDYSWARPNRRYQDIYLPGMVDQNEGLDHLIYYLDVSGSISNQDILRFHSEFKHVKETYQPEKMTMVQFDTSIQKEDVFLKDDPFEETHIIGRGGTSLVCVRENILFHNPTAVVIFSDLYCDQMELLPSYMNVPIIWVCVNNPSAKVKQGTLIHIKE